MEQPLINGHRYDFSSIELTVKGKKYTGFSEITYNQELDRSYVYGAHSQPVGRTRGQLNMEASISMFKEEYYELLAQLGSGYMEVPFDISVVYADNGSRTKNDRLLGCVINGEENSHSAGNENLTVSLTISPMIIAPDGKRPLKNPLRGDTFNYRPISGR